MLLMWNIKVEEEKAEGKTGDKRDWEVRGEKKSVIDWNCTKLSTSLSINGYE